MDRQRKQEILDDWQKRINSAPFTYLIPYPFCCVCFVNLTPINITVDGEQLVDLCNVCKALEDGRCSIIYHKNCECFHCGPKA